MRFGLVNPNWEFGGSTYFGCKEPHYPLELMFAAQSISDAGHDALLLDAHLNDWAIPETKKRLQDFDPDFLVIPTAPTYLFWRCPQPELRIPQQWFNGLGVRATKVAIGPHASATPGATLRKLQCDVVIRGEPDEALAKLASEPWSGIDGCCRRDRDSSYISPSFAVTDMKRLGALDFSNYSVELHSHRHHVFHGEGLGAELEFARGCPWSCTFCNKTLFRNKFRERSVDEVLQEVDSLIARGVDYIYFIDEIFGVGNSVLGLLKALAERPVSIGCQSRIDLWNEETLDLLARAHCISFECGVESITEEGREALNKNCRLDTERIGELLIYARRRIPWVQANLILTEADDRAEIAKWQHHLKRHNVWVSEPVPMFPFPGSPLYQQTFGAPPDEQAWERAHSYYTSIFTNRGYSDIQEQQPLPIAELELPAA